MRVLLDECVPASLRRILPGHAVRTVAQAGFRGFLDPVLLQAAQARFDILITVDRKIVDELDFKQLNIGVLLIRTKSNSLQAILPMEDSIRRAIESIAPGQLIVIP